jgi:type IV pilus assembly protein PilQ
MTNIRKKHIISILGIGIVILCAHRAGAIDVPTGSDFIPQNYENKTISMDFKGAKLSDVLKIFSQQSGLNFIASTEASDKTVNLYFDQVPVEEALERILSANQLTYELKPGSNIFIVKAKEEEEIKMMTRVYKLQHASVLSSKINSTFTDDDTSDDGSEVEEAGLLTSIEKLLSEDGSVVEDPRTNSLIVTDYPGRFPAIENAIERLDIKIPQILIEVEMLDISKEVLDELGAKFGNTPVEFTGGGTKQTFFPFNTDNAFDDGHYFHNPKYSAGTLSFSGLNFVINFLKTKTDAKSLARPRILTLNNETAKIHIKTDEAIGIAATNTTSAEGNSSTVSQAERVETGVFLTVTPQANIDTGEIVMAVQPKVIQATQGGTFSGQSFKDPEERGVKSMLRVNNGETIVIGGLLKTDYNNVQTSVPILSKIPILGSAFRHKNENDDQRELIIFITPNIIEDNQNKNLYATGTFLREQDAPNIRPTESALSRETGMKPPITNPDQRLRLIEKELMHVETKGL